MGKVTTQVTTSLLMRVGSTKSIEECYQNRTLKFSCAANWINYSIKHGNCTIGDPEECIFARLKKDDPRVEAAKDPQTSRIKDPKGQPMRSNLLITMCQTQDVCHLRFVPTILMPALCFYNIDMSRLVEKHKQQQFIGIDLDKYCTDMGNKIEECSFMLIKNPIAFYEDLYQSVPIACKKNSKILTKEMFYKPEVPLDPIVVNKVDYHRHKENEYFYDFSQEREEIFWKMPRYEYQSEVRFVIPGIAFKPIATTVDAKEDVLLKNKSNNISQNEEFAFNINNDKYDYKNKELTVELPHFQEYTEIFPAVDVHTLVFWNIREGGKDFCMEKLNMTQQELSKRQIDTINTEFGGILFVRKEGMENR